MFGPEHAGALRICGAWPEVSKGQGGSTIVVPGASNIPGILLSRNLQNPEKTAIGFPKERWLKRMDKETTPRPVLPLQKQRVLPRFLKLLVHGQWRIWEGHGEAHEKKTHKPGPSLGETVISPCLMLGFAGFAADAQKRSK